MNNTQKFQEIKNEITQNWFELTYVKKKELLEKFEKIRIFSPSFYRIFLISLILLFGFIFFVLYSLSNEYPIRFKNLSTLDICSIFILFSVFATSFIIINFFLSKAKIFEKEHGVDYKVIKNMLLSNIKELEENFYNKLDAEACESLSNKIYRSLIKNYSLPEDMTSIFVKDIKNFMKKYRFEDNDPLNKDKDESHAATRYANLEN